MPKTDIVSRIADFLQDVPVCSDATGMFIERDDLRVILEMHRSQKNDGVFIAPKSEMFAEFQKEQDEAFVALMRESLILSEGLEGTLKAGRCRAEMRAAPQSFMERI